MIGPLPPLPAEPTAPPAPTLPPAPGLPPLLGTPPVPKLPPVPKVPPALGPLEPVPPVPPVEPTAPASPNGPVAPVAPPKPPGTGKPLDGSNDPAVRTGSSTTLTSVIINSRRERTKQPVGATTSYVSCPFNCSKSKLGGPLNASTMNGRLCTPGSTASEPVTLAANFAVAPGDTN